MKYFTKILIGFILTCLGVAVIGGIVASCTHYRSIDCKSACDPNGVESCGWTIKCIEPVKVEEKKCGSNEYL